MTERLADQGLVDLDVAEQLREVRDGALTAAYEAARKVLRDADLKGADAIMLAHPIKAPFLEMYDSLTDMAAEIEVGKWAK